MFSNEESSNPLSNPSRRDVIDAREHQRRTFLKGSHGHDHGGPTVPRSAVIVVTRDDGGVIGRGLIAAVGA